MSNRDAANRALLDAIAATGLVTVKSLASRAGLTKNAVYRQIKRGLIVPEWRVIHGRRVALFDEAASQKYISDVAMRRSDHLNRHRRGVEKTGLLSASEVIAMAKVSKPTFYRHVSTGFIETRVEIIAGRKVIMITPAEAGYYFREIWKRKTTTPGWWAKK